MTLLIHYKGGANSGSWDAPGNPRFAYQWKNIQDECKSPNVKEIDEACEGNKILEKYFHGRKWLPIRKGYDSIIALCQGSALSLKRMR